MLLYFMYVPIGQKAQLVRSVQYGTLNGWTALRIIIEFVDGVWTIGVFQIVFDHAQEVVQEFHAHGVGPISLKREISRKNTQPKHLSRRQV